MTITAAADGSALGNPGPAGWAWYIDDDTWRAGGWDHGTNNMGELKAVLDLLESTAVDADQHLLVLCDSQYVVNSVTKWMPGWKRKGWRKKDGKPVLNVELLQAIDRALYGRSVEFEWVKGHSGHAMNDAADERARAVATAYSRGMSPEVGPGYRSGSGPESTAVASPENTAVASPAATQPADDLFSLLDTGSAVAQRELALLSDAVRADHARAAALLHPDVTEIGASGSAYTRDTILDAMAPLPGLDAVDMIADEIAPGVVLVRYTTLSSTPDGPERAHRSSLWVREGRAWLLRHHQGTPAPGHAHRGAPAPGGGT